MLFGWSAGAAVGAPLRPGTSRPDAVRYCATWRDEGIFTQLNHDLTGLARVKEGRKPEPTASVIDTQRKTPSSNTGPASESTSRLSPETRESVTSMSPKGAGWCSGVSE
jgi:hypothetical protein